ncbi:MAG: hypothetical protein AAF568_10435, partial [Pseudomonadota bacterium]
MRGSSAPGRAGSILVTGFEPFAGWAMNSSWEAVRRLDGPDLVTARLTVDHGAAATEIGALIAAHRPRAVLMCGLAPDPVLRLETCARRGVLAAPGPSFRRGRWPWDASRRSATSRGLPVRFSNDAGSYVCDTTYWAALGSHVPAVAFLHLPPVGPSWSPSRLSRAVAA